MLAWGRVSRKLSLFHPDGSHWYLAVLGVRPDHHGRGHGSALLRDLDHHVASDPAPIYLETDRPESARFYRARGFETRTQVELEGVTCHCLVKPSLAG